MGTYLFKAKTAEGKFVQGELEATNESEVRVKLRAQRLVPVKVISKAAAQKQAGGGGGLNLFNDSVSSKDLQLFTRQFAVLIGAGVPIMQSLDALSQGGRKPGMIKAIKGIIGGVEKGKRLADGMAAQPAVFDRTYVNLVRAGEEGGVLDEILNRLAEYIEKSNKLRGKIVSALWYPAVIIVVSIGVIAGILVFVIPSFMEIFASADKELPALTQMVITASDTLQEKWYVLVGLLVAVPVGLKLYYKSEEGRKVCDQILIELPVMGNLVQKGSVARMSRTLAALLRAGVTIMDALEISGKTSGNYVIEKALVDAKEAVGKGKSLAEPLRKVRHLPDMVVQMIAVGEQTGNLDAMLEKIADFYEDEVEAAADAMTSLIEPLLMVFLGGVIAVLVVAMYLPIFDLAGAVMG